MEEEAGPSCSRQISSGGSESDSLIGMCCSYIFKGQKGTFILLPAVIRILIFMWKERKDDVLDMKFVTACILLASAKNRRWVRYWPVTVMF